MFLRVAVIDRFYWILFENNMKPMMTMKGKILRTFYVRQYDVNHRMSHVMRKPTLYVLRIQILILNGPRREKTCLRGFENNTGADQLAHPRSLISTFIIRLLESIIFRLATSEILIF